MCLIPTLYMTQVPDWLIYDNNVQQNTMQLKIKKKGQGTSIYQDRTISMLNWYLPKSKLRLTTGPTALERADKIRVRTSVLPLDYRLRSIKGVKVGSSQGSEGTKSMGPATRYKSKVFFCIYFNIAWFLLESYECISYTAINRKGVGEEKNVHC